VIFIQGQLVRIPDGRIGCVTATVEGSLGETLYHVYTEDGTTMRSFFPEELKAVRDPEPQQFWVGDEVMSNQMDDGTHGTVTHVRFDDPEHTYVVKWEARWGCTSQSADSLILYKRSRDNEMNTPKFAVGDRVYYTSKLPHKFPLGVVAKIEWVLVTNPPPMFTGEVKYAVEWDNGVRSSHDSNELGSVVAAITALSQPIP
jgi:hypothetical protein